MTVQNITKFLPAGKHIILASSMMQAVHVHMLCMNIYTLIFLQSIL